jgi:hypothetical protein
MDTNLSGPIAESVLSAKKASEGDVDLPCMGQTARLSSGLKDLLHTPFADTHSTTSASAALKISLVLELTVRPTSVHLLISDSRSAKE